MDESMLKGRCHCCYKGVGSKLTVWELPKWADARQMALCSSCAQLFRAMTYGTVLEKRFTLYKWVRRNQVVRGRAKEMVEASQRRGLTTVTPCKGADSSPKNTTWPVAEGFSPSMQPA